MLDFGEKVANEGATASGRLAHGEDNVRFRELENLVSTSGVTLDPLNGSSTDEKMLAQATARYASGGVFYQDEGSANQYVLSTPLNFIVPKAYFEGQEIEFIPGNSNTLSSTVNVNSVGAVNIVRYAGEAVSSGDIVAGKPISARFDSILGAFRIRPWAITSGNSDANLSTGDIVYRATSVVPPGFLECDGASVSREVYSALFAEIGISAGPGNGVDTFDLPDCRGEFIRGWDNSRGIDATRAINSWQDYATARPQTTNANRIDENGAELTTLNGGASNPSELAFVRASRTGEAVTLTTVDSNQSGREIDLEHPMAGDAETRPRNMAFMVMIKY